MKNFKFKTLKVWVSIMSLLAILSSTCFASEDNIMVTSLDIPETTVLKTENFIEDTSAISEAEQSQSYDIVQNDVFLCSQDVNLNYPVAGNVFIIANTVNIDSIIDGNVYILANDVTLSENSYIYSDVFVCANSITIGGYLYNLYSCSNTLKITSDGYIIRDLNSSCKAFTSNGYIRRNANINAESISILNSKGIGGNLSYSSEEELSIPEGLVAGSITFTHYTSTNVNRQSIVKSYIKDFVTTLIFAIILLLLIYFGFKSFSNKSAEIVKNKFGKALGYGFLALISIPLISIILLFTIIGILPGIILLLAYAFVSSYLYLPILAIAIGKLICERINKTTNTMQIFISILSVLVILILVKLPVVGTLIHLIGFTLSLGIIVCSIFSQKQKEHETQVEVITENEEK